MRDDVMLMSDDVILLLLLLLLLMLLMMMMMTKTMMICLIGEILLSGLKTALCSCILQRHELNLLPRNVVVLLTI